MKKMAVIFLVLTGVLVVAICIAVPLGMANSEAASGSERCNSTDAVNGTCEDALLSEQAIRNDADVFTIGKFIDRDAYIAIRVGRELNCMICDKTL